jgi:hypothetical protein
MRDFAILLAPASVYITVTEIRQLREEYRETWQSLGRELHFLQSLTCQPVRDYPQIETALEAVQAARTAHNAVRDRLACALGRAQPGRANIMVRICYASSSISSTAEPANTTPCLMTRA